jgi:Flp pilus assembly protein TadG
VNRPDGDAGTAILEFTWLAVLLLVPIVYGVVAVFDIQRAAYGITQATREAGRAFVTAHDTDFAYADAYAAAWLAMDDQRLRLRPAELRIACTPAPCGITPGTVVHVRIDTAVGLPFLPRLFGHPPVPVHARHDEVIDTYRQARP